jgi:molybdenum cofactor cytidylyltransferase
MYREQEKPSCIILAAGNSKRMGIPKSFLRFNEELTFIEHIIDVYNFLGKMKVLLVVNPTFYKDSSRFRINLPASCKIVLNAHPEFGRLYSLKLGLTNVGVKSPVFIQNVDNPFVSKETLLVLQESLPGFEVVVPKINGSTGHPVLIGLQVQKAILSSVDHNLNLRDLLKSFSFTPVRVEDPGVLVNINTKEDYLKYFPRKNEAF